MYFPHDPYRILFYLIVTISTNRAVEKFFKLPLLREQVRGVKTPLKILETPQLISYTAGDRGVKDMKFLHGP